MKNTKALLAVGALVLLAAWLFVSLTGTDPQTAGSTPTVSASATLVGQGDSTSGNGSTDQLRQGSPAGTSGQPIVTLRDLPVEAQETYQLILDGGPYPYPQDDGVFGNREGSLPTQEYGWYREYTVATPGSPDRGARRFVVGDDGVFFYTDDHYKSFQEVIT